MGLHFLNVMLIRFGKRYELKYYLNKIELRTYGFQGKKGGIHEFDVNRKFIEKLRRFLGL